MFAISKFSWVVISYDQQLNLLQLLSTAAIQYILAGANCSYQHAVSMTVNATEMQIYLKCCLVYIAKHQCTHIKNRHGKPFKFKI